jgi:RNAse (barnase) inhibitor barstar
MTIVRIDARRITDWDSFHEVFAEAFGFPGFYGRNSDAWVDCMTCLDDAGTGMTRVHVSPGEALILQLDYAADLICRFREAYDEIVQCSAFVNWRRIERGNPPVLALSFHLESSVMSR